MFCGISYYHSDYDENYKDMGLPDYTVACRKAVAFFQDTFRKRN